MADPLKKVRTGEKLVIPAVAYNAFVDAAKDFQDRRHGQARQASAAPSQPGLVLVKNASGYDVEVRFGILAIDTVLITPDDNETAFLGQAAFSCLQPDSENPKEFVILQGPLKDNAVGPAMRFGITPVRVNVVVESHGYAAIAKIESGDSDTKNLELLDSASASPTRILWKEPGTGEKWAVVELGFGLRLPPLYQATSAVSAGQITGKRIKSDGTLVGDDETFAVVPE